MASEGSGEDRLIEKLRKTSSSKLWWPQMIILTAGCWGISGFVSWMSHQSRASIKSAVILRAVDQASAETSNYLFGFLAGLVVVAVIVGYAVRRKNRLLVSMYDRLKALEEKNAG